VRLIRVDAEAVFLVGFVVLEIALDHSTWLSPSNAGMCKRSIPDAWRHIGQLVDTITPNEGANYLANAGYASSKT